MKHAPGFTIIELVVVVGILAVVAGGVIANYNNFNESQRIRQAALTLKTNLRLAQTNAIAGNKPTAPYTCAELVSYVVAFSPTSYSIQAKCADPESLQGGIVLTALPSGITLTTVPLTAVIEFNVLDQGTSVPSDLSITLSGVVKSYTILVTPNGTISDLGFVN